jgi:hypothetical protein
VKLSNLTIQNGGSRHQRRRQTASFIAKLKSFGNIGNQLGVCEAVMGGGTRA